MAASERAGRLTSDCGPNPRPDGTLSCGLGSSTTSASLENLIDEADR
jgi:hypothetical protein